MILEVIISDWMKKKLNLLFGNHRNNFTETLPGIIYECSMYGHL